MYVLRSESFEILTDPQLVRAAATSLVRILNGAMLVRSPMGAQPVGFNTVLAHAEDGSIKRHYRIQLGSGRYRIKFGAIGIATG